MPKRAVIHWRDIVLWGCAACSLAVGVAAAQQPVPQKAAPAPVIRLGGAQVIVNGGVVIGGQVDPNRENGGQRVKLPVDPRARRKIEEARRFIETQDWQSAVTILQSLLNANEDNFLQEAESDKGRRVSVRAEANRMLGTLPAEGKRIYEQQYGSAAKQELKQARAQANPQLMANVALKYVHTESGAEAAAWLGAYHLDHGRYIVAALCFERLLARDAVGTGLPLPTLYKASLAFERAGDVANRDKTWKLIQAKLSQPGERLPAAIRSWDEERLKSSLKSVAISRGNNDDNDWRLFMGSPDRAAHSTSTAPFLEPRFPAYAPVEPGQARSEIEQASKKLFSLGVPVIPGCHPLVVRDLVIFRALDGVHAYNLKTGLEEWRSTSDASFSTAIKAQGDADPEALNYLSSYRETAPSILLENTLLGTLSADQELVYCIEDLAIPPNVQSNGVPWGWRGNPRNFTTASNGLGDFANCNRLLALDQEGGRVVWSIGTHVADQPFTDMYFLGPPLPLGDKLYVLAEVNAEIKLLCLQNRKTLKANPKPGDEYEYGVDLVWSQPLGVVDRKLMEDPVRRTHAAMLAYSDGILVCPTNAGSVIGVDLLTRSLVWAYTYQNEVLNTDTQTDRINFRVLGRNNLPVESYTKGAQWSFAAPVITQGKVLLAASDGTAIHAIHLRDGTQAWSVNRVDNTSKEPIPPDYYLAGVTDELALLVGKYHVRALDLKTGKQVWNTVTGMPCGRGIANEDTYFLPVRGNEVVSLSVKTGQITGRAKARHKESLGNLALVGEHFVSLNHHHLLVYPIQVIKEKQVAERLKANPADPTGLVDRGELRWHRGEVDGSIDDFRAALKNKPSEPVRIKAEAKLADSLLTLIEKDFIKHEPLLNELEQITVAVKLDGISADERAVLLDRKAKYYRLVAKGRETQGRIEDVLASYQAFAQLDDKLIVSPDDPQVRVLPRVWALAQAQAMARRLPAEKKQQLEAIVKKQWERVKEQSPDMLPAFVEFYGELGVAGQSAQLQYVEKQIENKEYTTAMLRLLPLLDASDAGIAARAYDAVARLNMRMGELENAAYYYRQLAKRYPSVPVRDGKTGQQLYLELGTDKRFLPYLDERSGLSRLQNVAIEKFDFTRKYSNNQQNYVVGFEPKQELPPHMRRFGLQVSVDMQTNFRCSYAIKDHLLRKDIFSKYSFTQPMVNYGYQEKLWPSFQTVGNIMVFSWANRVVGFDPIKREQVWSIDVLGESTKGTDENRFDNSAQLAPVQQMPGRFQRIHRNSTVEVLGTYGPGSSRRLAVTIKHEGLVCINPQTGEKLWSRYGIPAGVEMFGDDEYVIVIPPSAGRTSEDQTLAVRMSDGQSIPLGKSVEQQYRNALAMQGRMLLCRQMDELLLIDPVSEEAKWKASLPSEAHLVKAGLPGQGVGFLAKNGQLTIRDIATGKIELQVILPAMKDIDDVHFILEDKECFVFTCKSTTHKLDENEKQELFPMFQWLRSIPVNGPAVCLQRETGKVLWQETLPLQYLVVQRFNELPVLLCSAVTMKSPVNKNNNNVINGRVRINGPPMFIVSNAGGRLNNDLALFSKQTGKEVPIPSKGMAEFNSSAYEGRISNIGGFQELMIEHQTGKVELKSPQQVLTFQLVPQALASIGK